MSDEPGRGKFVDQAAEARPSVWRRTAGWIREEILHSLGRPARLEGAIASGQLIRGCKREAAKILRTCHTAYDTNEGRRLQGPDAADLRPCKPLRDI